MSAVEKEVLNEAARNAWVKAHVDSIVCNFEGALSEIESETLDRINHAIWVELAERQKVYDFSDEPF